jgi:hypothetical protein
LQSFYSFLLDSVSISPLGLPRELSVQSCTILELSQV